jgi:hypothetical protein
LPVLRMAPDTSLGDTLGRLGQSLTESLNPLNTMRAYDIQQQIWMRQQQVLQMQRENAAKNAAVQQWGHIVPPDRLPQIATMIYQGAPYDQVARAAAQLSGQLVDDPNAMQQNIRYIEQLTGKGYDYATLGPPVAGPNTAKVFDDWKVNQAGKSAASTALGTKTGEQAAAAPYMNALVDDPSDTGTAKNIAIIEHLTGQPYDASKGPPIAGPLTLKSNQDWQVANAGRTKGAEAAGTAANTPINPAEPKIFPPPGGFVSTAPAVPAATPSPAPPATPVTAPPVTAPPAATPSAAAPPAVTRSSVPAGATPDPNRPGWYWQGGTLKAPVTTGGPPGAIIGYDPNDLARSADESGAATKNLADAYAAGGDSAKRLMAVTAQIRALEQVSKTGGLYGQITAGPLRDVLNKAGFGNITTAQQAQSAEDNLLKNTLPGMLKEFDIQRFAKPEIDLMGQVTGSSQLPPGVLDNILANVDTMADYTIKRRGLAGQALGYDQSNPLNFPDYQQQDNALQNNIQPTLDQRRQNYGAVATQQPPSQGTAPPTQGGAPPAPAMSSIWDAVTRIFGGGSQAAPPSQQPPPNSIELDPSTGLPKGP